MNGAAEARWYVRCVDCLAIGAVAEDPTWARPTCGICAGLVETMGRVVRDAALEDTALTPCDDRCTSAQGPECVCRCGGANHGAHMVVAVLVEAAGHAPVVGLHTLGEPLALERASEFRAGLAELTVKIEAIRERRRAGAFLNAAEFRALLRGEKALGQARAGRHHKTRMAAIARGLEAFPS